MERRTWATSNRSAVRPFLRAPLSLFALHFFYTITVRSGDASWPPCHRRWSRSTLQFIIALCGGTFTVTGQSHRIVIPSGNKKEKYRPSAHLTTLIMADSITYCFCW
jgi:hypothetical protein